MLFASAREFVSGRLSTMLRRVWCVEGSLAMRGIRSKHRYECYVCLVIVPGRAVVAPLPDACVSVPVNSRACNLYFFMPKGFSRVVRSDPRLCLGNFRCINLFMNLLTRSLCYFVLRTLGWSARKAE